MDFADASEMFRHSTTELCMQGPAAATPLHLGLIYTQDKDKLKQNKTKQNFKLGLVVQKD